MSKSDAANKALGSITGRKALDASKSIPLWDEKRHDTSLAKSLKYKDDDPRKKENEEDETKGGPGSGNFGHGGLHGVHGGSGEPSTNKPKSQERDSSPKKPDLSKAATARIQHQRNRLAREVVASAAAIRSIEEKPFAGPKARLQARRHAKDMRKKLKQLDLTEDEVWQVLDGMPIQDQAMLASMAVVPKKSESKAAKVMKNIANHLLRQKIQDEAAKFAPSPNLEPDEVNKLSIRETAAYLAAYDSPDRATQFLKSLTSADFQKANNLRQQGMQNIISNTKRNLRNEEWLDAAKSVGAQIRASGEKVTQRQFDKLVSEELRNRSRDLLRRQRTEQGEPVIRFGGFGGN